MGKTRFKRPRGWKAEGGPYANVVKRQQKRAALRKAAFVEITNQFGGESRRTRRSMAFSLAKKRSR